MSWRVARSLDDLLAEVNKVAPGRKKGRDGTIGDQAHASRASRHNPNKAGVVTARDVTNDPAALPIHDMQFGPLAAFIAESFTPRLRYSGASLGYQLSCLTAGGPAPLIAIYLMHTFHASWAISAYIAVSAAVTVVATLMLPDRTHEDTDAEYDEPAA